MREHAKEHRSGQSPSRSCRYAGEGGTAATASCSRCSSVIVTTDSRKRTAIIPDHRASNVPQPDNESALYQPTRSKYLLRPLRSPAEGNKVFQARKRLPGSVSDCLRPSPYPRPFAGVDKRMIEMDVTQFLAGPRSAALAAPTSSEQTPKIPSVMASRRYQTCRPSLACALAMTLCWHTAPSSRW